MISIFRHPIAAAATSPSAVSVVGVLSDAYLGESAAGTLDGEDTGRDGDGDVVGDRKVELLEDLQHLVCWI